MNFQPLNKNTDGFTLIEVVISLAILCFISLGIYQLTTESYRVRDVIMTEGDFYNGIRLAMDVVGRDIAAIYSPELTLPGPIPSATPPPVAGRPPPPPDPDMLALMQTDAGRTSDFWLPAVDKSGLRPSRFKGDANSMTFISSSHVRIYKDTPESVFAQISYKVEPDPDNKDTLMLVRKECTDAFEDDDKHKAPYTHSYQLLHGIKKLTFRYWRKDKGWDRGWEKNWDNDKDDFKGIFPDIVEITVEVAGEQRLSFEGIYRFKPEVPLGGLDPSS